MKQIQAFEAPKYRDGGYFEVESGIYRHEEDGETVYIMSLSFVQEPGLGEGSRADEISQYPLEDLLDKFFCYVADYYEDLNTADSEICCLEFAAPDLNNVENLRSIIGKHVYNKAVDGSVQLIIE